MATLHRSACALHQLTSLKSLIGRLSPGLSAAEQRAGVTGVRFTSVLTNPNDRPGLGAISRALLVDTLDLMKRFEKMGMTRQQAEALTQHITEVLVTSREQLSENFVTKSALQQALLEQDAKTAGFKSEISKAQDMHQGAMNRETERLGHDLQKVRSEFRYEIDKLTASQRLDLNLEKGRMRDEMQAVRDKANELEIKSDKEVNLLKAQVEQTKNEAIKYSLGMMLAFATAGLGAARLVAR